MMGCCGDREKQEHLREEQRWEYINLDDFKASSCWTGFAYGWLWAMLFVSLSVYAVDTFTMVNLLAFDHWSGQIEPKIPITVARWIFAGCILLSFLLLVYRWVRAIRVIRQGGVAKSYLDPLAVRVQSIRMGRRGRGWRRFLVFAELTKSRKGADYVALFAYFSFEAWLRIVFAEGPRQVVNGITLYTVMITKFIPDGAHPPQAGNSPVMQFFLNIKAMADENMMQALVLFGMIWTLFIWVLSALSLAFSVILYLIFLWHHIPAQDGSLSKYCRNKIDRRMGRIVKVKVDKALKKENALRVREEAKAERDGLSIKKQPTLPNIGVLDDKMPTLSRQTTLTTLPEYESRPGSLRDSRETLPPLPTGFSDGRPQPSRHGTSASNASWSSYNSSAPLMSQAGEMGQLPYDRMQTPSSAISTPFTARPMTSRSATGHSQFSDRPFTPGARPATASSMRNGSESYQMEPIPRTGTAMSTVSRGRRQPSDLEQFTPVDQYQTPTLPGVGGSYFPPVAENGRASPAFGPPARANTFQEGPTRSFTPAGLPDRGMHSSSVPPVQYRGIATGPPPRSFTPSGPPPRSYTPYNPAGRPQGPDRAVNASVPPPERSFTPRDSPPDRSMDSSVLSSERSDDPLNRPPTLPRIQTSGSVASTGYTAFNPRSATPASASVPVPSQPYRSFSRPIGPAQRNSTDVNRDSGVDDILNHY